MTTEFRREFRFIDITDRSGRQASRTHVTAEFYRERRWLDARGHNPQSIGTRNAIRSETPQFKVSVLKLGPCVRRSRAPKVKSQAHDHIRRNVIEAAQRIEGNRNLSSNILGAGRVDPFATYPIDADKTVHQLVDHFIYVLPCTLPVNGKWRPRHTLAIIALFDVYRQDSATFRAMLHHSAHHIAKAQGRRWDRYALQYKSETLRSLNQKLADRGPNETFDDNTVVAAGLLANAERLWGNQSTAELHWNATGRMIVARGGFSAFKDNPPVHTKLVWSFIALAEAWPGSNPIYLEKHNQPKDAHDETNPANQEGCWTTTFSESCDELIILIAERTRSVLNSLPQSDTQYQTMKSRYPRRFSTFAPSSTLSRLLSAPSPPKPTPSTSTPRSNSTLSNCRLACLLYLNILLSSPLHTDFSPRTESFLATLTSLIADDDFDVNLSAEHLLWALIQGIHPPRNKWTTASTASTATSEDEEHRERLYATSRMLGVMKCVSREKWEAVEGMLRVCLAPPLCVQELMGHLEGWDPQGFRREIGGFLGAGGVSLAQHSALRE